MCSTYLVFTYCMPMRSWPTRIAKQKREKERHASGADASNYNSRFFMLRNYLALLRPSTTHGGEIFPYVALSKFSNKYICFDGILYRLKVNMTWRKKNHSTSEKILHLCVQLHSCTLDYFPKTGLSICKKRGLYRKNSVHWHFCQFSEICLEEWHIMWPEAHNGANLVPESDKPFHERFNMK